jgi:hypothetical protein
LESLTDLDETLKVGSGLLKKRKRIPKLAVQSTKVFAKVAYEEKQTEESTKHC